MMAQAKGTKVAQTATKNAGQGAKAGMKPAPYKPQSKQGNIAVPVVRTEPITGVGKTNPKKQPMYPGKPSAAGKTATQYGTGVAKTDGKAFDDSANARTTASKQKLNQG